MTAHLLPFLLQAAEPSGARDLISYLSGVAACGAFGFTWRTNARLVRIESLLTDRRSGVIDRVADADDKLIVHGEHIKEHGARLEGHDREIKRLDRDKEPKHHRGLAPEDVGELNRGGR